MKRLTSIALILTGTAIIACGGGGQDPTSSPEELIPQSYSVSECGGFTQDRAAEPELAYCDAEVLTWSYDAATGTLALSDNRINLNCCGERDAVLKEENGGYVMLETDAPEVIETGSGLSSARCHCMCVFDIAVQAEGVASGVVPFKLVRDVTDGGGPQELFSGSIDLGQGAGTIVIDQQALFMDASGKCQPQS